MVLEKDLKIDVDELYDFKQLEEIAAGNPEFIKALAKIYLNTIPHDSAAMVAATRTGDWSMVSKLAHKLKSTIDSMNITSVRSDIRTLEMDAKNKTNLKVLGDIAKKVDNVINLVAMQIRIDFSL